MKSTNPISRRAKPTRKSASKTTNNQTPTQRKPITTSIPRSPPTRELVEAVCGITDPFCPHSTGAKYPDASSVRTLPYTRRLRYTLASDASGFANLVISPQYAYLPYAIVNVAAGNTITSWSNFGGASAITGVSGYRIVSSGFVVRHIVSPLNSAGMVYIRQYGSETNTFIAPLDTTTYNSTAIANISVQDAKEIAVVLQRTSQMPQTFYAASTDTAFVGNSIPRGFASATVAVAGAPASTPILEIEFVVNFELIFEDSSDLAQVATHPPPASALLTSAAAHVTSTMTPVVANGLAHFGRQVATKAATALATAMFGPVAGATTRGALAITVD